MRVAWSLLFKTASVASVVGLLLVIAAMPVHAVPVTWSLDGSGDWNTGANWSTGMPPGPDDDVTIDRPAGNYTITVSTGSQTAKSLLCEERLVITGGSLDVTGTVQVNNDFEITGFGELIHATVNPGSGGEGLSFTGGGLDSVTMNADLSGTSVLNIQDGLILNGTATLGDALNSGRFSFIGSQTLGGTGEVFFPGLVGGSQVRSIGGTLTVDASLLIHGGPGTVGTTFEPLNVLGEIRADNPGGQINVSGQGWINTGLIHAINGGILELRGSWSNFGLITETDSELRLAGSSTTSDFNGISGRNGSTGSMKLITGGLIDNTAAALTITDNTGSLIMESGEIMNGTVTTTGSATLSSTGGGTLNGVTLETDVVSSLSLNVENGLVLNSTLTLGRPGMVGFLNFQGGQTLSGTGVVFFSGSSASSQMKSLGGTLTIGSGVLVHGGPGKVGASTASMINNGEIRSDSTGKQLNVDGSIWVNNGTVHATNGGKLEVRGDWSNTGTLTEMDSELRLSGTFTTADFAGVSGRAGTTGSLKLVGGGVLDNTATTLALTDDTGTLILDAGTIQGGNVMTAGSSQLVSTGNGTLDGVTLDTDITASLTLNILNDLTLNGTATMGSGGTFGSLNFQGSQNLTGTGVVLFPGPSGAASVKSTGGTLTVDTNILIHGGPGTVGTAAAGLIIDGEVRADSTGDEITVTGTNWVNNGTLNAINGGELQLEGSWTNNGTLTETDSEIRLSGDFTTAGLGVVSGRTGSTGEMKLVTGGILDNTSDTLALTDDTGSLIVTAGRLMGGTVTGTGSAQLFSTGGGVLDGVTLDANLTATFTTDVENGLTVNGVATLGNPSSFGRLDFQGSQSLMGTGEIFFPGPSSSSQLRSTGGTLTIGSTILVHGGPGNVGTSAEPLINDGEIRADVNGAQIIIAGTGWTNNGTLSALNGGELELRGSWSNTGTITETDSELRLGGQFTTADFAGVGGRAGSTGSMSLVSGTLDNGGSTLNLTADTGTLIIDGGTLKGGTVNGAGGAQLDYAGGGALDSVTVNAPMSGSGTLDIFNGLELNNTLTIGSGFNFATIDFEGTQTLGGTGVVFFGGSSTSNRISSTGGTLTIGPGILIQGGPGKIGNPLDVWVNQGEIRADIAGALSRLTMDGDGWSNTGTVRAIGGARLEFKGNWSNTGTITEENSELRIGGNFTTADLAGLSGRALSTGKALLRPGLLDNTATTLSLTASTGTLIMDGITILGGTVEATGGTRLDFDGLGSDGGTLDGVIVNCDMLGSSTVTVLNNLTINGTATLGNGSFPGKLDFTGSQTLNGTGEIVFNAAGFQNRVGSSGGTLTIGPDMTLRGAPGNIGDDTGFVINQGLIRAQVMPNAFDLDFEGLGFENQGTVEVANGARIDNFASFSNQNNLFIASAGEFQSFVFMAQAAGSLSVELGATLDVDQGFDLQGGILFGSGTIQGNMASAAVVSPGLSSGFLSEDGDYQQLGDGRLFMEIGGTNAVDYDQFLISGTASLAGTLHVSIINSFVPAAGDKFILLQYGSRLGAFEHVILPETDGSLEWLVDYQADALVLEALGFLFADVTTGALGDSAAGNGMAWGDYNGDGLQDLYITNGPGGLDGPANRLLRNDGGDAFTDVTSGPLGDTDDGRGAAWGDYDNDGDLDLYLANFGTGNKLMRNDGGGTFVDETAGPLADAGNGTAVAWVDVDNDGNLDIYLANHGANILQQNTGGGTFVDATSGPLGDSGNAASIACGDYNSDGLQDIYLGNLTGSTNKLLRNDGGGTFVDVTASPLDDGGDAGGVAWGDYDNDKDLDLYLVNDNSANKLFRNDAGTLVDATSGPLGDTGSGASVAWGDYDNDTDLDLYITRDGSNLLLRNGGGGLFVDATNGAEGDTGNGQASAWADHDNDGDLDLYLVNQSPNKLLRNESNNGNSWLQVSLLGVISNKAAIGARVRVVAGGVTQIREITAGSGFLSQGSITADFGLAGASNVDSIVVIWPSGMVQDTTNVAVDQKVAIGEFFLATPVAGGPNQPSRFALYQNTPNPFSPQTFIRFDLPRPTQVHLVIYNVAGRKVRTLIPSQQYSAGQHRALWDGRDDAGRRVGSGMYIYRLQAGDFRDTRNAVLVR